MLMEMVVSKGTHESIGYELGIKFAEAIRHNISLQDQEIAARDMKENTVFQTVSRYADLAASTSIRLLAAIILAIAGGKLITTLLLTAISCIILGMGMPCVASYLILSVMVVPALIELGVPMLAAHLFIFYFGVTSAITPPVAMAAYAGAGIAGSNPTKTGYTAFGLGIAGFIIPFMFVYCNELMLQGSLWAVILAVITAIVGVFLSASSVQGWMLYWNVPLFQRVILFIAALCLIKPGLVTDLIGVLLGVGVVLSIKRKSRIHIQST